MAQRVDIILVGDNNDITKNCVKSIVSNTSKDVSLNIIVEPFKGYNKSLNDGADKGRGEYIAFCNNDLIFKRGWDQPLISELNNVESVSPWCSRTHHQWWGKTIPKKPITSYDVGKVIAGWFIMMKKDTWKKMGGFDERFTFWCADNSYMEQIKSIGFKHSLVPSSIVDHLQSVTLNKQDKATYNKLTMDQVKLYNKVHNKNLFNAGK
jgi:GT2 family glycosyltransferase